MPELVIRDALLVDGTGQPSRRGVDIAVDAGLVTEVGRHLDCRGQREIAGDGRLVTPGFIDTHTHYDAQATWDALLTPSAWHGVTTAVMGNCGVGFAPAHADRHEWLIALMEGVEDIPGSALSEGITWQWETFGEYLGALDSLPRAIDVGAHIAHAPLRAYVMGERVVRHEEPTDDDLAAMALIATDAMRAGAVGFSTSRTMLHRTLDGVPVPGTFAGAEELTILGRAISAGGYGVFEVASDLGIGGAVDGPFGDDIAWMSALSAETGLPVTYPLLQGDRQPELWRELIERSSAASAGGGRVIALTAGRPTGILLGLETSLHPFKGHPTYATLEQLPLAARVNALKSPDVKAKILSEATEFTGRFNGDIVNGFWKMYPVGPRPNYEPAPEDSVEARARRERRDPTEYCYEHLLSDQGRGLLFFPLADFAYGNLNSIWERLQRDDTLLSLGDGGAHCRLISDASLPTFMLSYWARDRTAGPQLPLERVVALQTSIPAALYRFRDRGVIAPGFRADLNIIDLERLDPGRPYMAWDLPANGGRFLQRATGYVATICRGQITFEDGEQTGERPGRVVRGARPAPSMH